MILSNLIIRYINAYSHLHLVNNFEFSCDGHSNIDDIKIIIENINDRKQHTIIFTKNDLKELSKTINDAIQKHVKKFVNGVI